MSYSEKELLRRANVFYASVKLAKKKEEKKKKEKKDPKAAVRNRGTVVFDAGHANVKDDKDHFPINSEAQARNALARASQYKKVPSWYTGSLKSLVSAVAKAVKKKYKGIDVTEAGEKPGKQTGKKKAKKKVKKSNLSHYKLMKAAEEAINYNNLTSMLNTAFRNMKDGVNNIVGNSSYTYDQQTGLPESLTVTITDTDGMDEKSFSDAYFAELNDLLQYPEYMPFKDYIGQVALNFK